ncbi:MAG: sterol desaturase family protein [Chloroflexota bacterium]|nr:sterol desaturase family protein [Chloroflexota bacterium]
MNLVTYIGLNVLLTLAVAVFMEGVAWFAHKYVMHGFLWVLHKDHHSPTHRGWQKNDLFAVFFSLVSMGLIVTGVLRWQLPWVAVGLGMALYGVGYVLFHDVMFHRRIPAIRIRPGTRYLQRIVRAHAIHHQQSKGRAGGVAFGFLYAGSKYDKT